MIPQTERDSLGYLIDRCEYLNIPAIILMSRCPFRVLSEGVSVDVHGRNAFHIDPSTNEYRYQGQGVSPEWRGIFRGKMNTNDANTNYNRTKNNTVSVYGRYGVHFWVHFN